MNHFEEISPNQSLEDLKLQNNIRGIFSEYADDLAIHPYYGNSYDGSTDEPCEIILKGVLKLSEPNTTGAIELVSSIEDGYEEIDINITMTRDIGGEEVVTSEEYSVTSQEPTYDDSLGHSLDEDAIAHLRYLVRTADYSEQYQDSEEDLDTEVSQLTTDS
jgi:hypothetical protein